MALLESAFRLDKEILLKTRWLKFDQTILSRLWSRVTGIPGKTRAAVMGTLIIHDGATDRSARDWFRLLVHEQVHISQLVEKGVLPFYLQYLLEASVKPYREISFEKEAFRYGADQEGNDLALKLWQFGKVAVPAILSDPGLTDEKKSQRLTELGKQFYAEIIRQ
jgi:hypothetical protein